MRVCGGQTNGSPHYCSDARHRTNLHTLLPSRWSAAAAAAHHLTVRPRSVAAGFDLLSQQVAAKHSQSLRSTNITSPEKRGSFCSCRDSLTVAMLSLSRLANALAPGSARLFSAAAAGENSFKVCRRAHCKNQRMTFFSSTKKTTLSHGRFLQSSTTCSPRRCQQK